MTTDRHKTMSEVFRLAYGGKPYTDEPLVTPEDITFMLSRKRIALGIPDRFLNPVVLSNYHTDPVFETIKTQILPAVDHRFERLSDYIKKAKRIVITLSDMHDHGWYDEDLLSELHEDFWTFCRQTRKPNRQTMRNDDYLVCYVPAPHGAVVCPGCGQTIPVKPHDGDLVVVDHPARKAMCLAGGKPVHSSHVKPAICIDDL